MVQAAVQVVQGIRTVELYGQLYPAVGMRLEGLTPLLLHNAAGQLAQPRGGKKTIPTPEEEAELGAYRDAEGYLVFPAIGIRSSILRAAGNMRAEGLRGKKSFSQVLAGVLFTTEEWVPILQNGERVRDYAIDVRRAVVQKQGVLRARPRIDLPWEIRITFALDLERPTQAFMDALLEAANLAGRSVGIGDYRPERKGLFGRFRAEYLP